MRELPSREFRPNPAAVPYGSFDITGEGGPKRVRSDRVPPADIPTLRYGLLPPHPVVDLALRRRVLAGRSGVPPARRPLVLLVGPARVSSVATRLCDDPTPVTGARVVCSGRSNSEGAAI